MKIKGLRWMILTMVAIATIVNYIDRNALAVMWPGISEDLGLDNNDYANIIMLFMVSYALGQALFGKIFDMLGTRAGFILAIVVWSVSVALHAFARGVVSLGIFRFIMGFGEAGNWPGATKSNAEWFPIKERALAQGIFNSGAALGAVISAPLIAYLYLLMGWQATFIVIASFGFIWVVPWYILYKAAPDSHPWLSDEEREYILKGQKAPSQDESTGDDVAAPTWMEMLQYRQTWGVVLSRFCLDPVWWLFLSWLPIYLADQFGFNVKEIGMFAWIPYVGAAAGSLFGGWLSGRLISGGKSVNFARRFAITLGGVIMFPCLLLTAYAGDPLVAVLLIACILFGFQCAIGNIQTLPSDYFDGKSVGSLAGLSGAAAVVGVIITTKLVPMIATVSYAPVFMFAALLVPLSVLSVWLISGPVKPAGKL